MRKYTILQRNCLSVLIYTDRNLGTMCEDSYRWEKLSVGSGRFIDMDSLSRDPAFNAVALRVRKGSNNLLGCWKHRLKKAVLSQ